jgi:hypothetical protein
MRKPLTALLLIAALALIAGCGGDSDSDSKATTNTEQPSATSGAQGASGAQGSAKEDDDAKGTDPKAKSPVAAKQAALIKDTGAAKTPQGAPPAEPEEFKAPKGGDDSIQTYGEVADDSETEEIILAMRSFFSALATLDYPAICEGLTEANRESLTLYLKAKKQEGGCEEVLIQLLLPQAAPEARKAANGSVLEVRVEDETAFVMFTPEDGVASYFVMKGEEGGWKATGLASGTPFDPVG